MRESAAGSRLAVYGFLTGKLPPKFLHRPRIAHANFPDEKLAPAVVLLYLIVSGIVSLPYLRWNRRRHAGIKA